MTDRKASAGWESILKTWNIKSADDPWEIHAFVHIQAAHVAATETLLAHEARCRIWFCLVDKCGANHYCRLMRVRQVALKEIIPRTPESFDTRFTRAIER